MANLEPNEEHLNRLTEGFRYEEEIQDEVEAMEVAQDRSLKTGKVISVVRRPKHGCFVVSSHGICLIGDEPVAEFKRGTKIK